MGDCSFPSVRKGTNGLLYEGYLDEQKVMDFRLCPQFVGCSYGDIVTNRM